MSNEILLSALVAVSMTQMSRLAFCGSIRATATWVSSAANDMFWMMPGSPTVPSCRPVRSNQVNRETTRRAPRP